MEEKQKIPSSALRGHLQTGLNEDDFRDYIQGLLSTFMPEEYLNIYMSERMEPKSSPLRGGISPEVAGPFGLITMAFTPKYLQDINMEILEGLGDAVLGSVLISYIVKNWPNLRSAKVLADMKQYYTKNATFAVYADQLNLLKWVRRDPEGGMTTKDKADVFEAFVGAIAMIGEFYIADHMGYALVSEFMFKFYSLQEWHVDNPSFYQVQSSLYNDWTEALPNHLKPVLAIDDGRTTTDGYHIVALTVSGSEVMRILRKDSYQVSASAPFKSDAEEAAFLALNRALNVTREAIVKIREGKREQNNRFGQLIRDFNSQFPDRNLQISSADKRGQRYFVFIKEEKTEKVGKDTVVFFESVARGIGASDEAAVEDAIRNYRNNNLLQPIFGTNEALDDPDAGPQREKLELASRYKTGSSRGNNPLPPRSSTQKGRPSGQRSTGRGRKY